MSARALVRGLDSGTAWDGLNGSRRRLAAAILLPYVLFTVKNLQFSQLQFKRFVAKCVRPFDFDCTGVNEGS